MSVTRHSDQRLIARAVATLLVGVVLLWLLYSIRGALLIIYISSLLALGFTPMIRTLERTRFVGAGRLPRWAAILIVYFGLLTLIATVAAVVLPPLASQATQLWRDLPAHVVQAQMWLAQYGLLGRQWTVEEMFGFLPGAGAAFTVILGAVGSVIGTLGTVIAIVVLPYYLLVEADGLQRGLLKLFPPERRPWIARMTRDVTFKVGAWLNGQILLGAIIGVTASLGLWLLGVPYFYVLGLIAAIGEFVPIVGPIIAAIPAVLLAGTISLQKAALVAAFFMVQQFVEGNILVPRIMERQVGVSAWSVIVALLVGGELLGMIGAILAVPTAAIVQVFLQAYLDRDEE